MRGTVRRGLLAGAVGTTVIETVTWLDVLLRARAPSSATTETAEAAVDRAGVELPGDDTERAHRLQALGSLGGTAVGLGVGVVVSLAHRAGLRLPGPLGGVATGLGAMAATDGIQVGLGVADPRDWSGTDWLADAVPHLAYGFATHATLSALEPETSRPAPGLGLVLRSGLLGVAAGARASLGTAAPRVAAWRARRSDASIRPRVPGPVAALSVLGVAAELYGDKQPTAPSRLEPPGPQVRVGSAAWGATVLSRRADVEPGWCVLAAAAGAYAGTYGGAAWRAWAGERMPDWQAAVAEDAVALVLAAVASR